MQTALVVAVIGQGVAIVALLVQHWNLRLQLRSQATRARQQQEAAEAESRRSWLRERHDRVAEWALDAATDAMTALQEAKQAVSEAGKQAQDLHRSEHFVDEARHSRKELRKAHARLSMLAPAAAQRLNPLRAHLEHFEMLVEAQQSAWTGGVETDEWIARNHRYLEDESAFLSAMVDFLNEPEAGRQSGEALTELRPQVRERTGPGGRRLPPADG